MTKPSQNLKLTRILQLTLKRLGDGQFDSLFVFPIWYFLERGQSFFFLIFNITLIHILLKNFIEVLRVIQKI